MAGTAVSPILTTTMAEVRHALDLGDHELVSLVGGGGKTTTMFALGEQLPGTVVLTATTKMGRDRTGGRRVLFAPTDETLTDALARDRCVLAWHAHQGHKALGVSASTADRWIDLADHVIVEADGSRQLPFKAPKPFEPIIPSRTTTVVACVGADALGRVIADRCHRPLRVAAVAGCSPYERLTPERLARALLSRRGSRKDCPPTARFVILVNQVADRHADYLAELAVQVDGAAPIVGIAPLVADDSAEEYRR